MNRRRKEVLTKLLGLEDTNQESIPEAVLDNDRTKEVTKTLGCSQTVVETWQRHLTKIRCVCRRQL